MLDRDIGKHFEDSAGLYSLLVPLGNFPPEESIKLLQSMRNECVYALEQLSSQRNFVDGCKYIMDMLNKEADYVYLPFLEEHIYPRLVPSCRNRQFVYHLLELIVKEKESKIDSLGVSSNLKVYKQLDRLASYYDQRRVEYQLVDDR
jgi:hypothetical protein